MKGSQDNEFSVQDLNSGSLEYEAGAPTQLWCLALLYMERSVLWLVPSLQNSHSMTG
jgi:hypothetical protein